MEANSTGCSVIRLEGILDGITARRVEAALLRAEAGSRLSLDLTQVRESHDFAIAVLAQGLGRTRARVTIRGLRQHQVRMLRYFGVDAAQHAEAALSEAA